MNDDNNDDVRQSEDDALEPVGDVFNPDTDEEKLDEDNDTPAASPDDTPGPKLSPFDPRLDSNLDEDEEYQEGEDEASGVNDNDIRLDDRPQPLDSEDDEE